MRPDPFDAPIAAGRTAEIYPWGDGVILKLFYPWVPLSDVELERNNTSAARAWGVSAPAVYDIVQHGDRFGLVFERVEGPTLLDKLQSEPEALERWARHLAQWHLALHRAHVGNSSDVSSDAPLGASSGIPSYVPSDAPSDTPSDAPSDVSSDVPPAPSLPDQRQWLLHKINDERWLTPQERAAVLNLLTKLPVGQAVCHGDFHPGNVLLRTGTPVIIDWIDASLGNPLADVARTTIVLLGHAESGDVNENLKNAVKMFHRSYLEHYMAAVPDRWQEYEQWLVVAAAARLSEGIEEQQRWLLSRVKDWLARQS